MNSGTNSEIVNTKVLQSSVIFTITFTIIALIVGILTSSQVILFDGVFNLVGVALTYLSIVSMKFIKKKDEWNYPFGKETFEPFIVITQYCIILYVCTSNIFSAVQIIMEGGRQINITSGIIYGVFAAIFNIAVFLYLKQLTKRHSTAIAEVEIAQWKFSYLLSIGILLGFSIAGILERTSMIRYSGYIDPLLTILITLIFSKTAIVSIRECVRELMIATPSEEIALLITNKIDETNANYQFNEKILRLGKVGSKIIIEINYIIDENCELNSISNQDELRRQLRQTLLELPYEKWLTITFTGDTRLADHRA